MCSRSSSASNVSRPSGTTQMQTAVLLPTGQMACPGLLRQQGRPARGAPAAASAATAALDSFDIIVPLHRLQRKVALLGRILRVLALTVEILHHATTRGEDGGDQPTSFADKYIQAHAHVPHAHAGTEDNHHPSLAQADAPSEADILRLLQLYLVSSNQLYGFVDPTQVAADLEVYYFLCDTRRGHGRGVASIAAGATAAHCLLSVLPAPRKRVEPAGLRLPSDH